MFTFVYSCGHEHVYQSREVDLHMEKLACVSSHIGETYANVMMRCQACSEKYTDSSGKNTNHLIRPIIITLDDKAKLESEMVTIGMPWVKFTTNNIKVEEG